MTQRDFERELTQATGETKSMLRQRGFSIVYAPESAPLTVDWEKLAAERVGLFPDYQGRNRH